MSKPDLTTTQIGPSGCTEIRPVGVQKLVLSHTINEKETYSLSCRIDKYSDAACQTLLQEGEDTAVPGSVEIADDTEYAPERKYSSGSVQTLCVPDRILAAHFFNRTFASYKYIERDLEANSARIRIGDDPQPEENTDIISDFLVSDSEVENRVSHDISLSSSTSSLQTRLEHGVRLETKFSDMLQSAADAVGFLAIMRQKTAGMEEGYAYIPFILGKDPATSEISIVSTGDTAEGYMQRIYDMIILIQPKDSVEIGTAKNEMKLVAMPNMQGISLYYDVDMIFSDKGRVQGRPIESGLERSGGIFGWSWPTDSTRVTSCFNEARSSEKGRRLHKGLDIGSKEPGNAGFTNEVRASGDPDDTDFKIIVEETNTNCPLDDTACGGRYGNFVKLKHEKGDVVYYSLYAHLDAIDVSQGQEISPGRRIGTMGDTGSSTAKHLHFEIADKDGNNLEPCEFIKCADSTLNACELGGRSDDDSSITTEVTENGYYFYDEEVNTFEKMPLQLHIKAEDYLPAIDCQKWSGAQLFRLDDAYNIGCFPEPSVQISYPKLYTCGEANKIEGLAPESGKNEGDRIEIGEFTHAICTSGSWNIQIETGQI
ncbi:MAG: M23 family metallopeptidase [Candidatus Aenigmarchaeota archaeon]|nr:M23 family metallopeptidase [Candidatus Aenigmarchaeota archaeon]